MKITILLLSLFVVANVVSGQEPSPDKSGNTVAPNKTPTPYNTRTPKNTPTPDNTPAPSNTPTPKKTPATDNTPTPGNTPATHNTPTPSSTPQPEVSYAQIREDTIKQLQKLINYLREHKNIRRRKTKMLKARNLIKLLS